jgi:hypothetical protein
MYREKRLLAVARPHSKKGPGKRIPPSICEQQRTLREGMTVKHKKKKKTAIVKRLSTRPRVFCATLYESNSTKYCCTTDRHCSRGESISCSTLSTAA